MGIGMISDRSFNVLSYTGSAETTEILKKICSDEKIPSANTASRDELLESVLDGEADLIVLHTDIGENEIIEIVEILKNDALCKKIPVIVISNLEDNDEFALNLSESAVISILTYASWKYQCQNLLRHLNHEHEYTGRIHDTLAQSESQNHIDPLTGTLNRFGAENKFQNLVGYYASNRETFSVIIFDIDHFKSVNDTYGHAVGDEVLMEVSSAVRNTIRKYDALIRFGGEEFIVLLSDADLEIAKRSAENLRLLIESTPFSSEGLRVTASFGVVEYTPGESMDLLIEKADKLMYVAKAGGRNQVYPL